MPEEFGKGFSETTIRSYRQFYLAFPNLQIQQALPAEFKIEIEQIQQTLSAELASADNQLATNKLMYAAKYLTYMPSQEELRREIERQKEIYQLQHPNDAR